METTKQNLSTAHAPEHDRSAKWKLSRWRKVAHAAFTLSLALFLAGTAISVLTAVSVLEGGVAEASLTVSFLLLSLACSFIGAHALDRIDEILRKL